MRRALGALFERAAGLELPSRGAPALFAILWPLAVLAVSSWLLRLNVTGDSRAYETFYALLDGLPFQRIAEAQLCAITSAEPAMATIYWLGANAGLPRVALVTGLNALLIAGLSAWLWRNRAPWITWVLLMSGSYLLVLLLPADRLKIAYIALILAVLLPSWWQKGLALALALLSHVQTAIIIAGIALGALPAAFAGRHRRRIVRLAIIAAGLVAIGLIFLGLNFELVAGKLAYYGARSAGLSEMVDVALIILVGLVAARDRLRAVLLQLPCLILSLPLGSSRLTMIGYSLLVFQLVSERRSGHLLMVLLMGYVSWKSVGMVETLFVHGNLFGPVAEPEVADRLRYCRRLLGL